MDKNLKKKKLVVTVKYTEDKIGNSTSYTTIKGNASQLALKIIINTLLSKLDKYKLRIS